MTPFEAVLAQVLELETEDKIRLIETVRPQIEEAMRDERSHRSLWGSFRDLGTAPTDEDLETLRQDMWGTFPRSDVGPR